PGERFTLSGGIEATMFMVPGKLPLYLEGQSPDLDTESPASVGIELQRDGATAIFVPGAASVTEAMRERFAHADVVLFDGTLFTDDEMVQLGTSEKTGRRMGHMPIDGENGSLRMLNGLRARRVYVHINNTNPILIDDSKERRKVEAAGWSVAEDGMEIAL